MVDVQLLTIISLFIPRLLPLTLATFSLFHPTSTLMEVIPVLMKTNVLELSVVLKTRAASIPTSLQLVSCTVVYAIPVSVE